MISIKNWKAWLIVKVVNSSTLTVKHLWFMYTKILKHIRAKSRLLFSLLFILFIYHISLKNRYCLHYLMIHTRFSLKLYSYTIATLLVQHVSPWFIDVHSTIGKLRTAAEYFCDARYKMQWISLNRLELLCSWRSLLWRRGRLWSGQWLYWIIKVWQQ